jgi:ATP adenylyltransferase
MDRIWAPWRMNYIQGFSDKKPSTACIFCDKPASPDDRTELILARREHCFALMNLYPYNNSHLMVVPYRHLNNFTDLTDPELLECQQLLKEALGHMQTCLKPQGFNIGLNMGKAGGAGIDQHLHWHLVPRWTGDTNFMTVTAGAKVISETVEASWERLYKAFNPEQELTKGSQ